MTERVLLEKRVGVGIVTAGELRNALIDIPDGVWICVSGKSALVKVIYEPGAAEQFIILQGALE